MFNMIVAHTRNGGIGKNNLLPWTLKTDLKRFKKLTVGDGTNSVIMGKNTWDSLPEKFRPLPNRKNIVISRKTHFIHDTVPVFNNLNILTNYVSRSNFSQNWIIGGAELYKTALEELDINEIYITRIENDIECDTFFPNILDYNYFKIDETQYHFQNHLKFRYEIYSKKSTNTDEIKTKVMNENINYSKHCENINEREFAMYCM